MIKGSFVFAIALFTLSCSNQEKERKIAVQTTTKTTVNTQESTVKKTSALELESQFKGCKAHW